MRVKPKEPGSIVRNPIDGVALPSSGRNVPNTSFWRRRLAAGDVVPVEVETPKAPAEESAPASRKPSRTSTKGK